MDDRIGLLDLFELERLDADIFLAPNPETFSWGRVFGGQVVAQALRAAAHTVDADHAPHSLHSYFIRGGAPGVPIRLEVDRTRDGRSFTTRRVTALQEGNTIFCLQCSLHRREDGPEYQLPIAEDVPDPLDGSVTGWARSHGSFGSALEVRELGPSEPDERGVYTSTRRSWVRVSEPLVDDPVLHQCVIAFLSDMGAAMGARVPHLMDHASWGGASLDHSLWFHRHARADQWLLFDLHAVSNAGARGFTRGTMHTRDGVLVASIVQEALLRPTGRIPG